MTTVAELGLRPLGQLLRRPPRYGINAAGVALAPGVPTYLRITDIDEEGRFSPSPKVGVDHPKSCDYVLRDGEMVFARTGASVGKSYLYDPRDGELVYAGFLINIAPEPRVLNAKYLSLVAQTQTYWDWVARTSVRSGQPGINGREYAQLPILLPDIATQNAIARTMADVDELIVRLERLIAKKRAIKQGMMQQLLAGKTRLAGFTAPWSDHEMGGLGVAYGGLTGKTKDDFETGHGQYIPFMAIMSRVVVTDRSLLRVRMRPRERQNTVRSGDLLFNVSSETPDELAMCAVAQGLPSNTYLNSFCFGFRLTSAETADAFFLAYLFRSGVGRQKMSGLAQGAIRYNLSRSQFRDITLTVPVVDEQRAIAAVLRDSDEEIDVLVERLAKAKTVKTGIMQQLLTGRTRLPAKEPAE